MSTADGHSESARPIAVHRIKMTETMETFSEREEIEMLLPWYVSGKLDRADFERVEAYLSAHPEMRMQLDLIGDEQHQTITANETLGAPSPGALDRLRAAIAAETPEPSMLAQAGQSLWQELRSILSSPTPRAVQWAGAAAALVLIAQAGIIGSLITPASGPGTTFTTASGPQADAKTGTFVLVRFAPEATSAELAKLLASVKGQIVAGPKPGGLFEVKVSAEKLSNKDRDEIIAKLKSNSKIVTMVLPKG